MTSRDQPQPDDLSTGERLETTMGAVAQGIRYTVKGEHETEGEAKLTVEPADVDRSTCPRAPGPRRLGR